jgi:hypothetical protein
MNFHFPESMAAPNTTLGALVVRECCRVLRVLIAAVVHQQRQQQQQQADHESSVMASAHAERLLAATRSLELAAAALVRLSSSLSRATESATACGRPVASSSSSRCSPASSRREAVGMLRLLQCAARLRSADMDTCFGSVSRQRALATRCHEKLARTIQVIVR